MDACELLIDAGADINYIPEGITLALYKNLLWASAVPNRPNRYGGYTALDLAVSQRQYLESINEQTMYYDRTIDFLCSKGATQAKTPDACSGSVKAADNYDQPEPSYTDKGSDDSSFDLSDYSNAELPK